MRSIKTSSEAIAYSGMNWLELRRIRLDQFSWRFGSIGTYVGALADAGLFSAKVIHTTLVGFLPQLQVLLRFHIMHQQSTSSIIGELHKVLRGQRLIISHILWIDPVRPGHLIRRDSGPDYISVTSSLSAPWSLLLLVHQVDLACKLSRNLSMLSIY